MYENKPFKEMKNIITILFIVVIFVFVGNWWHMVSANVDSNIHKLNKDFDVSIGSKEYKNVNIEDLDFNVTEKGDKVIISKELSDVAVKNPAIGFVTKGVHFNCYINNELVYRYTGDYNYFSSFAGDGYFTMAIPDDFNGKNLKIIYDVVEGHTMGHLGPLYLGSYDSVRFRSIRVHLFGFFVALFYIVGGLLNLFLSVIFKIKTGRIKKNAVNMGLFLMFSGMIMFVFLYFFTSITCKYQIATMLLYGSAYLVYIPFYSMYFEREKTRYNKKIRLVLCSIYYALLAITVFAAVSDLWNFKTLMPIYQILVLVTAIYAGKVFAAEFERIIRSKTSVKMLYTGFGISIISVFLQFIAYFIYRCFPELNRYFDIGNLYFVFFLILTAFMLSNFYVFKESFISSEEKKSLKLMADFDKLTGLYSRSKIRSELLKIKEKDQDYYIIMYDLNNLKICNDTFGHEYGDILLKSFANCIKNIEVDKEINISGRIGGDEFITIYKTESELQVKEFLSRLDEEIEHKNMNLGKIYVSAAYGYASNKECEQVDYEEIMKIADKRMYERKKEVKEKVKEKVKDD